MSSVAAVVQLHLCSLSPANLALYHISRLNTLVYCLLLCSLCHKIKISRVHPVRIYQVFPSIHHEQQSLSLCQWVSMSPYRTIQRACIARFSLFFFFS